MRAVGLVLMLAVAIEAGAATTCADLMASDVYQAARIKVVNDKAASAAWLDVFRVEGVGVVIGFAILEYLVERSDGADIKRMVEEVSWRVGRTPLTTLGSFYKLRKRGYLYTSKGGSRYDALISEAGLAAMMKMAQVLDARGLGE